MAPEAGPRKAANVTMPIIRILCFLEKAVYGGCDVGPFSSPASFAVSFSLSMEEMVSSKTAGSSFAVLAHAKSFSVSEACVDCFGEGGISRSYRGTRIRNKDVTVQMFIRDFIAGSSLYTS